MGNDPKFGKEITYFCPNSCNSCPKRNPHHMFHASVKGCEDANQFCGRYREYCPKGRLVGQEQWMAENCRKTCNIAKHCGGKDVQVESPGTIEYEADAPSSTCIDTQDTGLLNALGQMESCAGLQNHCRDSVIGA